MVSTAYCAVCRPTIAKVRMRVHVKKICIADDMARGFQCGGFRLTSPAPWITIAKQRFLNVLLAPIMEGLSWLRRL
jgi:hypothetical protein